ncbi:putative membrane protein [Corynebacterium deserti GIMN1.010]|uniref:Putative membrane protein n=1 Tax=Corynebacterium deserti GIMN1.010 TaxID=931089 RepID=A0A0M4CF25_9CORY|nr:hypothetical protein [Corynebacterium deserti]ALC05302.1 putative membrane protein [Corynebacterium deserti GIMN1.010]
MSKIRDALSADSISVITVFIFLAGLAILNWVFHVEWAWALLFAAPLAASLAVVQLKGDRR